MKTLLIVSFYFPPIMSAGSVRIGKFAKYLPGFGWDPIVLTVAPKEKMARGIPLETDPWKVIRTAYRDPVGIFSRPPGNTETERPRAYGRKGNLVKTWLKRLSPFTIQRMPDRMAGWIPYAVKAGKRILTWDRIDAVFSSHPTPASHLIAAKLSEKGRVPWVADYRDLWTGSTLRPYPTWLEKVERRYERKVLRQARALTTVSEPLRDYLFELHGKPVEVIYNGFDPDDFKTEPRNKETGVFTLVYSGTLYTSKQTPVPFFEALKSMKEKGAVSPETFRVRFIGVQTPPFQELVVSYVLNSLISAEPFQPYEENVATLKSSDALLFFSWNEGEMEGNPTSKIFQYMGARRPILVVGDANVFATDLVRRGNLGGVGRTAGEIEEILTRWLHSFESEGRVEIHPDPSVLRPFDRRFQAGQLAALLDRVTS